jgi:DNA transformation protein
MPVSDGYLTYVLDQLRPIVPGIRVRRMFGAVGLYATDLFFAVVDDDVLYLKVDDSTRPDYETRGMPPFRPFELHASMNYSQLPEEILEERETLQQWTNRSLDVARSAKKSRASGKGATKRAKKRAKKPAKKSAKRPATKPAKKPAKKRRR